MEDNLVKQHGEASSHCHCLLFQVTDEMRNYMQGGQPYRRCKEAERKAREEKEEKQKVREHIRNTDRGKEKNDLKNEVIKLRNKLRKEARSISLVSKVSKVAIFSRFIHIFHFQSQAHTSGDKQEREKRRKDVEAEREAIKIMFSSVLIMYLVTLQIPKEQMCNF